MGETPHRLPSHHEARMPFFIGQVVYLNSGGPAMTVIGEYQGNYKCMFIADIPRELWFHGVCLTAERPEPQGKEVR